jgi:hypothetical protein
MYSLLLAPFLRSPFPELQRRNFVSQLFGQKQHDSLEPRVDEQNTKDNWEGYARVEGRVGVRRRGEWELHHRRPVVRQIVAPALKGFLST